MMELCNSNELAELKWMRSRDPDKYHDYQLEGLMLE